VMRVLADALLSAMLAPACVVCGQPLEAPTRGPVCEGCWSSVRLLSPPLCATCGGPLPSWRTSDPAFVRCPPCESGRPRALTSGRSAAEYTDSLRAILHALKYGGRRAIARPLGRLMHERGAEVLDGADFVVPVPLHWRRQWSRGFNQAAELASAIGLPVVHALGRTRHTPSQTDLPAERRRANVWRAFGVRRRAAARVRGACVVVIDDVRTTGATLEACAQALVDAGARDVRALTAARVVTPPHVRHG
jgi:ComF family protein